MYCSEPLGRWMVLAIFKERGMSGFFVSLSTEFWAVSSRSFSSRACLVAL